MGEVRSGMSQGVAEGGCPHADDAALMAHSFMDPAVTIRPNDYYGALRRNDPVHYDEALGLWLVSRHEDVVTVLRDHVTYSQRGAWDERFAYGHFDELKEILERDGGGFFGETLLLDPPEHGRIRRLTEKAFTAHRVKQLEPRIAAIAEDLVDAIADRGTADGMVEIAAPYAIRIMCEQLGLDYDEVGGKITDWAHAYIAQVGQMQTREQMRENAAKIAELQNYIIARIEERQAEPREDMISDLIAARLDDEENPTLSFGELVATVRGMINGGTETTATALMHILRIFATQPELADALYAAIDDDAQLARFVEEALRMEPPARGMPRLTTRDVELGGVHLPKGTNLLLLSGSANDDEAVFECPRDFDMRRRNVGRHLTFGNGPHLCVGMSLARMELKVATRAILRRLRDIRLAVPLDEVKWRPGITTFTADNLPLTFARR